jgi:hypothetical protein
LPNDTTSPDPRDSMQPVFSGPSFTGVGMSALNHIVEPSAHRDQVQFIRSRSTSREEPVVNQWRDAERESDSDQSIRRRRSRSNRSNNLQRGINTLRISLRNRREENKRSTSRSRLRRNTQTVRDETNHPYFIIGRNINQPETGEQQR